MMMCLLALLSVHAGATETVQLSSGSAGCLEAAPPPPRDVRVREKDSKLLVSWKPPAGSHCVDTYVLDLYDPSSPYGSSLPVQTTSTDGTTATLGGLQNGVRWGISRI